MGDHPTLRKSPHPTHNHTTSAPRAEDEHYRLQKTPQVHDPLPSLHSFPKSIVLSGHKLHITLVSEPASQPTRRPQLIHPPSHFFLPLALMTSPFSPIPKNNPTVLTIPFCRPGRDSRQTHTFQVEPFFLALSSNSLVSIYIPPKPKD
ncbi:hypothetical protein EYC84_007762 [Monilinia fructicola]|uniref:Uncharacterized protein n=1 Tax=Monilinia fructicola TaxID=38448 RepID=A0A5M9JJE0_MONFR|nr:hypothetical protein EYC84_007762 [Monilinia fructicola]